MSKVYRYVPSAKELAAIEGVGRIVGGVVRAGKREDVVLEGRERLTLEQAQQHANRYVSDLDQSMMIGGVRMHTKTNVAYTGLTQVGKTSAMKLSIVQPLKRIKEGSREKVIIFDASNEFVPFVYAHVGEDTPVYVLNPADSRCYQWDMAKDVRGAANTTDLSHTIVKDKENDTPFFIEGARCLTAGVMDAFYLTMVKQKKHIAWTLRDVACATSSGERIKAVLDLQPKYLAYIKEAFLQRNNNDVFSTLIARTKELRVVAAMWHDRPKFSLREFLESEKGGVLILGTDSNNRATILELNRMMLERAGKLIANKPECPEARYWFFLDEFQLLGKSEIVKQLIKDGLKRGVRLHLACQNRDDVVETYGKENTSVIFSECGTQYLFRQGDGNSAEQASRAIGNRKILTYETTRNANASFQESKAIQGTRTHSKAKANGFNLNSGVMPTIAASSTETITDGITEGETATQTKGFGLSESVAERKREEAAVSTGALQNYDIGEFVCYAQTVQGYWLHRFDWAEIEPVVKGFSSKPEHAPFIARDESGLFDYLEDWDEEDLKRLGLPLDLVSSVDTKEGNDDEETETLLTHNNDDEQGETWVQKQNRKHN